MPRRLRAALSGGLAGLSQGFEDVARYRLGVKRQQEQADYQDKLLRQRQEDEAQRKLEADLRSGAITPKQYAATQRGDIEAMTPSVSARTAQILRELKMPGSVEEFNVEGQAQRLPYQPVVSPTRTDRGPRGTGPGIDVFEGPSATASLMDPRTQQAAGLLKAQRRRIETAHVPETRAVFDPALGAKVERTRQYSPVTGEFRELEGQAQLEPTGTQKGAQEFAARKANELAPERLRLEREAEVSKEAALRPGRVSQVAAETSARKRAEFKEEIAQYGMTGPQQSAALQLSDDFTTQSREYYTLERQIRNVGRLAPKLARGEDLTPAEDMTLIYAYMKAQSPESSVMPGEYASAQNTTGIPGWLTNLYNKSLTGKILNATQAKDFLATLTNQYQDATVDQKRRIQDFRQRAGTYRIPPQLIIREPAPDLQRPYAVGSIISTPQGQRFKVVGYGPDGMITEVVR